MCLHCKSIPDELYSCPEFRRLSSGHGGQTMVKETISFYIKWRNFSRVVTGCGCNNQVPLRSPAYPTESHLCFYVHCTDFAHIFGVNYKAFALKLYYHQTASKLDSIIKKNLVLCHWNGIVENMKFQYFSVMNVKYEEKLLGTIALLPMCDIHLCYHNLFMS